MKDRAHRPETFERVQGAPSVAREKSHAHHGHPAHGQGHVTQMEHAHANASAYTLSPDAMSPMTLRARDHNRSPRSTRDLATTSRQLADQGTLFDPELAARVTDPAKETLLLRGADALSRKLESSIAR